MAARHRRLIRRLGSGPHLSRSRLRIRCGNASKPVGPGEQAVIDINTDEPVSIGPAYQNQISHGKDPDTLHGGFVGIDCNGDGVADVDTFANPHGEVPGIAQTSGSPNHGVVELESAAPESCNFQPPE